MNDFEVRHWKACDRGAEAAAETRTTWKKGDWDWIVRLGWHCSQGQRVAGQYSGEGQLPSDSPVSGSRTPMAHECLSATR